MRGGSYLVAGLAGLGIVVADQTQWATEWVTTTWTETAWSTKPAETLWSTSWETVTSTVEKPVTITDTITDTSTVEQPITVTDISTLDFTTTVFSVKSFETAYTEVQTVFETITAISESISGTTAVATATKYITVTETVASLATSVTVLPGTTVIIENTKTITQAYSSSTLSGIVPCPTRITNTDYSPPTPLPTEYTWGCPPGQLCKPKQVNCNFEVGYPDPGYVCSPCECTPAEPPPDVIGGQYGSDYNSTCPWFQTFDDYFNLPPPLFGLTYNIFAVSSLGIGAGDCPPPTPVAPPPPPPPTTTSVAPPPPPPPTTTSIAPPPPPPTTTNWLPWTTSKSVYIPPPVSSSTTQWVPWTTSKSVYIPPPVSSSTTQWVPWTSPSSVYVPAPASSSSSWGDWVHSSSAVAAYSSASTWAAWHSTSGSAYPSGPPRLSIRDSNQIPAACYVTCSNCGTQAQAVGKVPALCLDSSRFETDYRDCQSCITQYKSSNPKDVQILITQFDQWVNYCNGIAKVVSAPAEETSSTTIKPPTSVPATTTSKSTTPVATTPKTTTPVATTPKIPPVSTSSPSPPPQTPTTTSPIPPPGTTSPTSISVGGPVGISTTPISTGSPGETTCAVTVTVTEVGTCGASGAAITSTSTLPNTSVSSFTSGNGVQATQRPVAAMVVGVAVVIAMV